MPLTLPASGTAGAGGRGNLGAFLGRLAQGARRGATGQASRWVLKRRDTKASNGPALLERKHMKQIDQRSDLKAEEFVEEYLRQNKPVVLRNAAPYWRERWTPQWLKQR